MIPIEYCIQIYGAQHLKKALLAQKKHNSLWFLEKLISIDMTSHLLNPSDNLLKKVK